ncbi:hypothetical protein A3J19_01450 [Candidatus Daviesbacteria bacterium RIFCSPLOWO2_02_FULL_41_8]|uniref:Methyltransferase type 11 domain-containing protein n=3 Tax=Candidatus Daviesiibacteriota TaxID=1752718 RepID=A0A1F5NH92_9BACT|nr:MAG: hypothetical protein A2871_01930 [Candidatus Daviesbacteria bacterium RIFCSPHIGHO2_01_FULL_41_23]OGE33076.1 MAG: hypothetical protein A3D83_02920 [Candidatus Daviesbacteria bacterium RIFCSPHIGHO2_02_FULL_41_10]OGE76998.1 MAG: hypothetical protein A3J19_01450 [Candidatus Daviesbacteria bacterium RIFCSPLOWO2_02_FULL_41_8]
MTNKIECVAEPATTGLKHLSRIARFYDSEIDGYDNGYSTPLCQAEDEVLVHLIQDMVGSKVVDAGCGTGDFLKYFQPTEYVGFDISHQMVKTAQQKYGGTFMVADMHHLSLPNDYFDTLVSFYGPMSYSLNPQALIQEFTRVVKPGGSLIVMPYTKRSGEAQKSSILEKKVLTGDYSTATNPNIEKVFYSTEMLKELFKGFADVRIVGINFAANGIEYADGILQSMLKKEPISAEFYRNYMLWELENIEEKNRPVEYARHALVTARKPGKSEP